MTNKQTFETMMDKRQQEETRRFIEFLESLTPNEKIEFMGFVRGAKFAKGVRQTQIA